MMDGKLVHELSWPSHKSELDLWAIPPTNVAIRRKYEVEYQHVANITHQQTGGSKGEDSKVLRVVENPGKSSKRYPFVHLYFNDTNYINVPLRNFHNINIRLLSASSHYELDMTGTTTAVLHFMPHNNCEELRKSSSIPVARNRSGGHPHSLYT